MQKDLSILGAKIGHHTVIKNVQSSTSGDALFLIRCDICGAERSRVRGTELRHKLRTGKPLFCDNCRRLAKSEREEQASAKKSYMKHYRELVQENILLYYTWEGMKARCTRTTHHKYKDYGARGIYVCDEWRDNFLAFLSWSLSHGYEPHKGLSIDRIDNDDGYKPDNCRWATYQEQNNNRRTGTLTVRFV